MNARAAGAVVLGQTVDEQTRCVHYRSVLDVVAIRFACCGRWYPCLHCHEGAESHAVEPWPRAQYAAHAILCGVCSGTMSIRTYLAVSACPMCGAGFNPGCALHHPVYFC